MIFDDVACDARLLVELAATLDPEVFSDGNLNVINMFAFPDRLEQ